MIRALVLREVRLCLRGGVGFGTALGFFLSLMVLVPLALGPDPQLLGRVAPGFLWIFLLLSVLLSSEQILSRDFEDGSLEVVACSGVSLPFFIFLKAMIYWGFSGLPLALVCPILGILLHGDFGVLIRVCFGMVVGSLGLCLIATVCGALTLGVRRGGALSALLALPLYLPILVFGLSFSAFSGVGSASSLALLMALVLTLAMGAPFAAAALVRAYLT